MSDTLELSRPSTTIQAQAGSWGDYLELTKPRVTTLVLITTAVGFYLGSRGGLDLGLLLNTLIGTWLVASGTSALNQYLERDCDARMQRTRHRPLPERRLRPLPTLFFATLISVVGMLYLALTVNLLTSLLASLTLASYIFVYTPLKKQSSLAILVGAVPGALPPVGGWAAAAGILEPGSLALFGVLFLWQLPHSLAIAWMYRDDYERGGFRLLPKEDAEGTWTFHQILGTALILLPVSLTPTMLGVSGVLYFSGAILLGLGMLWYCLGMARSRTRPRARRVVLASVFYLPALLILMTLDKL